MKRAASQADVETNRVAWMISFRRVRILTGRGQLIPNPRVIPRAIRTRTRPANALWIACVRANHRLDPRREMAWSWRVQIGRSTASVQRKRATNLQQISDTREMSSISHSISLQCPAQRTSCEAHRSSRRSFVHICPCYTCERAAHPHCVYADFDSCSIPISISVRYSRVFQGPEFSF
jgi:hypothetical protein